MTNEKITIVRNDRKRRFDIQRRGETFAYISSHGDGKRWDLMDGFYRKVLELPARTEDEIILKVEEMARDGSLDASIGGYQLAKADARMAVMRSKVTANDDYDYLRAKEAELKPKPSDFDGLLRPAIPMSKESHRLLRAVAIKRSSKIPGEPASIGAIIEELIQAHRDKLQREAGGLLKIELKKKS